MIQKRSVGTCIVLSLITCGIYGLYWLACQADDVNILAERPGPGGGIVVLLSIVTCGIYGIYWYYKAGEVLDESRRRNNIPTGYQGILYLVLSILGFGIVSSALIQSELNKYTPVDQQY